MSALFTNLRRAANDFRPAAAKPRVTPLITFAQQRKASQWRLAGGVMLAVTLMTAAGVWFVVNKNQNESETKPVAAVVQAQKPVAAASVPAIKVEVKPAPAPTPEPLPYTDIVLPSESLEPAAPMDAASVAPTPDGDPAVAVVAEKIGNLTNADFANRGEEHSVVFGAELGGDQAPLLTGAYALLQAGNHAAALALYNRVLDIDPTNKVALAGKTYALQQSHHPKAIAGLEQMVAANPDDALAQASLAKALAAQGDFAKALPHQDRAARLDPTNLLYRLNLAVLYDHTEHKAEALALYRQVLHAGAAVESASDSQDTHLPLPVSLPTIRERAAYLAAAIKSEP